MSIGSRPAPVWLHAGTSEVLRSALNGCRTFLFARRVLDLGQKLRLNLNAPEPSVGERLRLAD